MESSVQSDNEVVTTGEGISAPKTNDEAILAARALAAKRRKEAREHEHATDGLICTD